ncbi:MAG: hypothetical protein QM669_15430 [Siphonobacter sp.]
MQKLFFPVFVLTLLINKLWAQNGSAITNVHAAGRLRDGDLLFVLKVPTSGTFRYEQVNFRVIPDGKPVFMISISADNGKGEPTGFTESRIFSNTYLANYSGDKSLVFMSFIKRLTQSGVFAQETDLAGPYAIQNVFPFSPTGQESDYVFKTNGTVLKSPVSTPQVLSVKNVKGDFKEVLPLVITKPGLDQVPTFTLPEGAAYTGPVLPEDQLDLLREFVLKGNTYYMIRPLVSKVDGQRMSMQEAKRYLATLPQGVGFYEMLGNDDIRYGVIKGIWDNPVKATPNDVFQYFQSWWYSRAERFGLDRHPFILDLDFEGLPPTWQANSVLAEGLKLMRKAHPNLEFMMYDSGLGNLYLQGEGGARKPYGQIGGPIRHDLYKDACTLYTVFPYAHFDKIYIGAGKPYANFSDYARHSNLYLRDVLGWLDQRSNYINTKYKGFNWVMTKYEGGEWNPLPAYIIESLPLWLHITGAARTGGGLTNWKEGGNPLAIQDYALEAGKWRLSQFNSFWNDPVTQYNLTIDYSLDGGKTWLHDVKQEWKGYESPKPMAVRGALRNGQLLVVATHRSSLKEGQTQTILCRYQNKIWPMVLPYGKVVTGTIEVGEY